jgi:predicted dehydrogenase
LGGRGKGTLKLMLEIPDIEIVCVCDEYDDRAKDAAELVRAKTGRQPFTTGDYRAAVSRKDVEAVVIATSWTTHIPVAIAAVRAGKRAAMEVGGASSVSECFELVRASEETGIPVMLLENCCYGREEMAVLNMVRMGLFGTLVHCAGGYQHDLRGEIGWGDVKRHYRQENFYNRNGELYPTHELGPIAKLLNINEGNRMVSLYAMASKAAGLSEWFSKNRPDSPLATRLPAEGDIVTTLIKCSHGETITLVHDCTLPRNYSRGGRVQGTKGIWMEDGATIFLEGLTPVDEKDWTHKPEPFSRYMEKYDHPLWKEYRVFGERGGHGGMDYLVMRAFIESVQNQTPPPIDVYDTAAWMSVTPLSEESIATGMPVAVPDFTNGRFIGKRERAPGIYALDNVYNDCFVEK